MKRVYVAQLIYFCTKKFQNNCPMIFLKKYRDNQTNIFINLKI